ncbi:unnamed protein product [Chilo suppressalis]|uniref:Peptidase S1 domain-containing protein n=1 Tax=Chilo suppressalis TaxID=168631 RepID=A0ABN8B1E0_CHISP|nr:hypothetical protein evm_008461 [Chilo suppressalis]CAH0402717.1 unnamed protein product [Chilo suppressalis]
MLTKYIPVFILLLSITEVLAQFYKIVGGYPATIDQYPVMGQMLKQQEVRGRQQYVQHCAGVIVTLRHLISTAHCFQYDPSSERNYALPKYWKVRVGSSFRTGGGSLYNLKTIIPHEGFNRSYYFNDIAVVVVDKPIRTSVNVKQSKIIQKGLEVKPFSGCVVAGWGAKEFNGAQPDQLHYTFVFVVNRNTCEERYRTKQAVIDKGMLCAGLIDVGGLDACVGDSGGPLIHKGVVIGLVSFGYSCGHTYYPGVYTNLAHYTDWINKTTLAFK